MATTYTSILGLAKPVPGSGEPVDLQKHLNDNWDIIDAAIAGSWIDFSGSFSITSQSSTDPTKGNSTYDSRYKQIGKTVHHQFHCVIGSGFVAGSGAYRFKLPVLAAAGAWAQGSAWVFDLGTGVRTGIVRIFNPSYCEMVLSNLLAGALGSAGPGTAWATGDTLEGSITYEAA